MIQINNLSKAYGGQVVLQIPGLRDGRFRFSLAWQHPAVRRIFILYAPILAALIVNQEGYEVACDGSDNAVRTEQGYVIYAESCGDKRYGNRILVAPSGDVSIEESKVLEGPKNCPVD